MPKTQWSSWYPRAQMTGPSQKTWHTWYPHKGSAKGGNKGKGEGKVGLVYDEGTSHAGWGFPQLDGVTNRWSDEDQEN